MNYAKLEKIDKFYFGYKEVSKVLGITLSSAMVTANRYVKRGFLVRGKTNLYVLKERWDALEKEDVITRTQTGIRIILPNIPSVPQLLANLIPFHRKSYVFIPSLISSNI